MATLSFQRNGADTTRYRIDQSQPATPTERKCASVQTTTAKHARCHRHQTIRTPYRLIDTTASSRPARWHGTRHFPTKIAAHCYAKGKREYSRRIVRSAYKARCECRTIIPIHKCSLGSCQELASSFNFQDWPAIKRVIYPSAFDFEELGAPSESRCIHWLRHNSSSPGGKISINAPSEVSPKRIDADVFLILFSGE